MIKQLIIAIVILATSAYGMMPLYPIPTGSPAGAYLVVETFEGYDSVGYDDVRWIEFQKQTAGTINEDYDTAPAPLRGSFSLFLDNITGETLQSVCINISPTDTLFVAWIMRYTDLTLSASPRVFELRSGGVMQLRGEIKFNTAPANKFRLIDANGTNDVDGEATAVNTTYYNWIDYAALTGVSEYFQSTNTTKGAADISIDGASLGNIDSFCIMSANTNNVTEEEVIWDDIFIDNIVIGDNPWGI